MGGGGEGRQQCWCHLFFNSIDASFKADTNKIKAKMPAGKLTPIASSQPAPIGIFVVTEGHDGLFRNSILLRNNNYLGY